MAINKFRTIDLIVLNPMNSVNVLAERSVKQGTETEGPRAVQPIVQITFINVEFLICCSHESSLLPIYRASRFIIRSALSPHATFYFFSLNRYTLKLTLDHACISLSPTSTVNPEITITLVTTSHTL